MNEGINIIFKNGEMKVKISLSNTVFFFLLSHLCQFLIPYPSEKSTEYVLPLVVQSGMLNETAESMQCLLGTCLVWLGELWYFTSSGMESQ